MNLGQLLIEVRIGHLWRISFFSAFRHFCFLSCFLQSNVAPIRLRRSTSGSIAWVALANRLGVQDELLFSRGMRMLSVRCALATRYFRTPCMRRQATAAQGGAGRPAGPASHILL